MKRLQKLALSCFMAMVFAFCGLCFLPSISLAAEPNIIVQINAKYNGENVTITDKTYYVALFKDSDLSEIAQGPKSVTLKNAQSGEIKFSGLSSGTYYVAQTNSDGTFIEEEGVDVTSSTSNGISVEEDGEEDVTIVMTFDYSSNPNASTSSNTSAASTTAMATVRTTVSTTAATTRYTTATTATTTSSTVATTASSSTATNVVTTDSAKTADDSHIAFYSIVAMFCCVAAGWIVYERKSGK